LRAVQNKKAIFLLLLANVISGFAQGISMLSIPWYFTNIKNNEQFFGLAYTAITIISIFWGLYSGTLIDKYSRKGIFLGVNIIGAIVLLGSAALGFYNGTLSEWIVITVFGFTMLFYNIHYPCLYAFAQEVSESGSYGKINSMIEIQGQATTMAAGFAGAILLNGSSDGIVHLAGLKIDTGIVFKSWSMHEIFLVDGITYVLGLFLIGMIVYTPKLKPAEESKHVFRRMKEGTSYLKHHKKIFLFGNCSYSIFVVLLIEVHLLLAWYVNNHLNEGAEVYALAEVLYAVGALFAGFAIRRLFKGMNSVLAVVVLMITTVIVLFWVSFSQQAWIFYAFSAIIGVTNAGARVLRTTWLFEHVPNYVMGRVGSVFNTLNTSQRLLFSLLFSIPFFSKGSNVTWAYFIGGIFILLNLIPVLFYYTKLQTKETKEEITLVGTQIPGEISEEL
jgi:MFS transporter, DHA3 family, macrolide efflux protein